MNLGSCEKCWHYDWTHQGDGALLWMEGQGEVKPRGRWRTGWQETVTAALGVSYGMTDG